MWNIENDFKVKIGGNIYIKTPIIISYKGQSIFTLKRRESDGQLGIDFDVYDKNRQKIATGGMSGSALLISITGCRRTLSSCKWGYVRPKIMSSAKNRVNEN